MSPAVSNPVFARLYHRARATARARGEDAHRVRLLEGLAGRVVDVGAGDGANFAFFPASVTEVIAVEPEPRMRGWAVEAAAHAPVPVRVVDGLAERLPLADGEVDAAVVALVLCSVPDQARALAEIRRVLRPGGELRFYEHVHADGLPLRLALAVADRSTLWPRLAGGCHPTRDTGGAITAAGFRIERLERLDFNPAASWPPLPHILGRAVTPARVPPRRARSR